MLFCLIVSIIVVYYLISKPSHLYWLCPNVLRFNKQVLFIFLGSLWESVRNEEDTTQNCTILLGYSLFYFFVVFFLTSIEYYFFSYRNPIIVLFVDHRRRRKPTTHYFWGQLNSTQPEESYTLFIFCFLMN